MRPTLLLALGALALSLGCASAASPPAPGAGGGFLPPGPVEAEVLVRLDSSETRPISPLIYGLNFAEQGGPGWSTRHGGGLWGSALPRFSLDRFGGNRLSGHDWETGYSSCGNDCGAAFPNDDYLLANLGASSSVGGSIAPRLDFAARHQASFLLTIPLIGFAARDASGPQPIPVAPAAAVPATPSPAHWLKALARDPAGATATPVIGDSSTYTDDLVKWVQTLNAGREVQYQLDNEPDLWFSTHAEIRGTTDGHPPAAGNAVATGFDELIDRTLEHARAVKSVAPQAPVWAGGFALWDGLVTLHYPLHPSPPPGHVYYFDYFLERLREASGQTRLVDVVDVHWYPQDWRIGNDFLPQTPEVIQAREQAPRSLWDPEYLEDSWVSSSIPAGDRQGGNCRRGRCPVRFLPRLAERIARFYPGTGLAIGEYWYGRGGDISGAIAEADVLGIFGKSGLRAAALWPNAGTWAYNQPAGCKNDFVCTATRAYACAFKAIDLYRNYDGANASFGDTSIPAAITDPAFTSPATQAERLSVHASLDAGEPGRVVIVAINKSLETALNVGFQLRHTLALSHAEAWQLTGANGGAGGCSGPARLADVPLAGVNALRTTLPPQSITVLVLKR